MNSSSIQVEFDLIGAITAVVASLWFLYQYVIRPRLKAREELRLKNQHLVEQTQAKVAKIYEEMYTNGGTTLRDSINRIEEATIRVGQIQHIYLLEHDFGILETDAHGRCTAVNRTYCRITDRSEGESLGTGWIHNIHQEDRDKVVVEWKSAVQGERDFHMTFRIVQPSGKVVNVFGSASPMKNPFTEQLIGYMATIKLV